MPEIVARWKYVPCMAICSLFLMCLLHSIKQRMLLVFHYSVTICLSPYQTLSYLREWIISLIFNSLEPSTQNVFKEYI